MKLQKIYYNQIERDLVIAATTKALKNIFSTKVQITQEEDRYSYTYNVVIFEKEYKIKATMEDFRMDLFILSLEKILNSIHGYNIFDWDDIVNSEKACDIFNHYLYLCKFDFLRKNKIDLIDNDFKKSIKTHILKRYGL